MRLHATFCIYAAQEASHLRPKRKHSQSQCVYSRTSEYKQVYEENPISAELKQILFHNTPVVCLDFYGFISFYSTTGTAIVISLWNEIQKQRSLITILCTDNLQQGTFNQTWNKKQRKFYDRRKSQDRAVRFQWDRCFPACSNSSSVIWRACAFCRINYVLSLLSLCFPLSHLLTHFISSHY